MAKVKTIIVFGGTGFIGYHVCKRAVKKNFKVFSVSKKPPKIKRKIKGVKYLFFDITKYTNFKKIENSFNIVVNASGYGKHLKGSSGLKLFNSHRKGFDNILKNFKNKKIEKFIQIGSSFEYKESEFTPLDQQSLHTIFGNYKGVSLSGGLLLKAGIAYLSYHQATLKLNHRGFAIFDLDLSYIQVTLSKRSPSAKELLTPNFRHYVEEKIPHHRLAAAAKKNLYTNLPLTLNVTVGPTTVTIKKYTDFAHYLVHASENMHYPNLLTPDQNSTNNNFIHYPRPSIIPKASQN